ncbi:hypothetical protein [Priestia megaterium]|uniref:hypothetical protein n=1 Tax=Priestia megaterium TaxID=1404 RepID=UPI0011B3697C|nr:hypothetical protein [Priestia megaterium]QDZ88690.1 hypothetical protein D0441_31120 [Priestia megaterium]
MKADDLLKKHSVHHWAKYSPHMPQYTKYARDNANVILAGHKIDDVYTQFCNARASLIFMEVDDYGQIIEKPNDINLKFIRSKFLFDALALYNYCIDLSWQVLYLYYGDAHVGITQDEEYYLQATKDCNMESLEVRLSIAKRDGVYNHVRGFMDRDLTHELRKSYNYIKHRGTYHIEGLGLNDDVLPIGLGEDLQIKMLNRQTLHLDEFKEKLIQFDISFVKYFEDIIYTLMPEEFIETSMGLEDMLQMARTVERWNKKQQPDK